MNVDIMIVIILLAIMIWLWLWLCWCWCWWRRWCWRWSPRMSSLQKAANSACFCQHTSQHCRTSLRSTAHERETIQGNSNKSWLTSSKSNLKLDSLGLSSLCFALNRKEWWPPVASFPSGGSRGPQMLVDSLKYALVGVPWLLIFNEFHRFFFASTVNPHFHPNSCRFHKRLFDSWISWHSWQILYCNE